MENRVDSAGLAHGVVDQTAEPASDEIARYQCGEGAGDTDAVLQEIVGQKFKLGSDGERSFLLGCRAALGGQGSALILSLSPSRPQHRILSMGNCTWGRRSLGGRGIIADWLADWF